MVERLARYILTNISALTLEPGFTGYQHELLSAVSLIIKFLRILT